MSNEIKQGMESIASDFHEFKHQLDAKNKDTADRINAAITAQEEKLEAIQTTLARAVALDKHAEMAEIKNSKAGIEMLKQLASKERDSQFGSFLRGKQAPNGAFETAGWSGEVKTNIGQSSTNNLGGYGIPTIIQPVVDMIIQETSPIEKLAQVTNVGYASDGFHGVLNSNDAAATWGAEPNTAPYNTSDRPITNTNTFTRVDIKYWELFANAAVTLQSTEDVQFDIEAEVLKAVGDKLARARASAFVNGAGDGSYQPKGFTQYTLNNLASNAANVADLNQVVGTGTGGTAQTIQPDDVFNLVYALRTGYEDGASFAAHRLIIQKLRELKSTTGQYLWAPADANFNGLVAGQAGTLAGYPIYRFNDMVANTTTASTPVLMFANWAEYYRIVNRVGLMMLRDPYSQTGQVIFKTRQRVGGGIFNGIAGVGLTIQQT
jgi:HK97 family phage major capsid protein